MKDVRLDRLVCLFAMARSLATLLAGLACLVPLTIAWQTDCESFSPEDAADITFLGATYYPANATVDLATNQSTIDVDNLPAFCRLQLHITTNTTANSTCYAEVWLPDAWNGRFLTVGNGGLAGGGVHCASDLILCHGVLTEFTQWMLRRSGLLPSRKAVRPQTILLLLSVQLMHFG